MKNIYFKKLTLLSSILLLSTVTFAEKADRQHLNRAGKHRAPPFCVLDVDKDGVITEEEYEQHQTQMRNNQSRLNKKRRRGGPPAFCALDLDDDGSITLEEFKQKNMRNGDHETKFSAIDANADGVISEQELTDYKPLRKKKRNNKQGS